jgi:homoserine kinase
MAIVTTTVRFRPTPVRVRVPATSANLGPGFDALGLALELYDEVIVGVAASGIQVSITGEGAGDLPVDASHLVVTSMMAAFDRLGARPGGLILTSHNRIPQARGLGSSSAAAVAGILAARALVVDGGERLSDGDCLALATEIEGHPDNVAPCLLGGFTIAWEGEDGARAVRLEPAAGLPVTVLVPTGRGLTAEARAALPDAVPHRDAAWNVGRAALLVHALTTRPELLLPATGDRLHQPYRAAGMPGTAAVVAHLREAGIPAVVSGAGPTVLAFVERPALPEPGGWNAGWQALGVNIDAAGAIVEVDWQHAERDPVAAGWAS